MAEGSSWNKGLHYIAGGRAAETQFKTGRLPQEARNYAPIGSTCVRSDGYLYRKVSDDLSLAPKQRWVAAHRLVWEAANGPVPAGQTVAFKQGRKTTEPELITLDAIEVLTRAELMTRNRYQRFPKEVAQLIQLKGALARQINTRSRALEES